MTKLITRNTQPQFWPKWELEAQMRGDDFVSLRELDLIRHGTYTLEDVLAQQALHAEAAEYMATNQVRVAPNQGNSSWKDRWDGCYEHLDYTEYYRLVDEAQAVPELDEDDMFTPAEVKMEVATEVTIRRRHKETEFRNDRVRGALFGPGTSDKKEAMIERDTKLGLQNGSAYRRPKGGGHAKKHQRLSGPFVQEVRNARADAELARKMALQIVFERSTFKSFSKRELARHVDLQILLDLPKLAPPTMVDLILTDDSSVRWMWNNSRFDFEDAFFGEICDEVDRNDRVRHFDPTDWELWEDDVDPDLRNVSQDNPAMYYIAQGEVAEKKSPSYKDAHDKYHDAQILARDILLITGDDDIRQVPAMVHLSTYAELLYHLKEVQFRQVLLITSIHHACGGKGDVGVNFNILQYGSIPELKDLLERVPEVLELHRLNALDVFEAEEDRRATRMRVKQRKAA